MTPSNPLPHNSRLGVQVGVGALCLQAIGAIAAGFGLVNLAGGAHLWSSAPDLRTVLIAIVVLTNAAAAASLSVEDSEVAAVFGVVSAFITGCASAVDVIAQQTQFNASYLILWCVGSIVIIATLTPLLQRDRRDEPIVRAPESAEIRVGLRSFLDIRRRDLLLIVGLTLLAFGIRFISPVYLPVLSNINASPPVAASGIGYPFNGPDASGAGECTNVPVPPAKASKQDPATPDANGVENVNACGFVFDEIYFPVDAADDLHQPAISYFDPEPPLTKLLMTPPIQFLGFSTWSWRLSTCVFGSLLAGLMYMIALRLRRDRFFATIAGLLVCLDGLALVESRIGVIDIIAIFWAALMYYAFLLHWQARTRSQWRGTLWFLAAITGLAFAAKLTAIAPMVLIAVLLGLRLLEPILVRLAPALLRLRTRRDIGPTLWREAANRTPSPGAIIAAILVLIGVAAVMLTPSSVSHPIKLATAAGCLLVAGLVIFTPSASHYTIALGVVFLVFCLTWSRYLTVPETYYNFTACDATAGGLTGTPATDQPPTFKAGGLTLVNPLAATTDIVNNMEAGLKYHSLECHGHPYASNWYTWPIMEHPVLFYYSGQQADTSGKVQTDSAASITDMGNPAIWWPGIAALCFCVWRMLSGPLWWRLLVVGSGIVGLAGAILVFQYTTRNDTVAAHPAAHLPLSFWFSFACLGFFGAASAVSAVIGRRFVPAFIVMGYELAWLMWVPGNADRVLFYYHALGMMLLMMLAFAYMLAALRHAPIRIGSRMFSAAPIAYAIVGVVVAAFVFFYPVWTAQPLPSADHGMRVWTDSW